MKKVFKLFLIVVFTVICFLCSNQKVNASDNKTYEGTATPDLQDIVYSCNEFFNVYDNLCTNNWVKSGQSEYLSDISAGSGNLAICVTKELLVKNPNLYVGRDYGDDDAGNGSWAAPFKTLKKAVAVASSTSKGSKIFMSIIGGFLTGIVGTFLGVKMQKEAARAGRYTAKRELEKDPMNFIGYTEEELAKTDAKNTSKKVSSVKEVINFVPTCIKQYLKYMKYKKTEFKENQILKNQLKKQDVTEEQLKDARNLQNKLFVTFENVDDKSQEYSESMEATCDMAKPIIIYSGELMMIAPFLAIISAIAKGT